MKVFGIDEREEVCVNCKYFVQHYVHRRSKAGFTACYAGHCTNKRLKDRKPGDTCPRFEAGCWEDNYE